MTSARAAETVCDCREVGVDRAAAYQFDRDGPLTEFASVGRGSNTSLCDPSAGSRSRAAQPRSVSATRPPAIRPDQRRWSKRLQPRKSVVHLLAAATCWCGQNTGRVAGPRVAGSARQLNTYGRVAGIDRPTRQLHFWGLPCAGKQRGCDGAGRFLVIAVARTGRGGYWNAPELGHSGELVRIDIASFRSGRPAGGGLCNPWGCAQVTGKR